ncbi:MAG: histidine phosphatase family protein [Clostridia bacterium]|nr:histidine phosphatase family protein [Clostridia bacterium]
MTKLLLIRHGESAHNHDKIFAGQIDSPLSETGEQQAERVCRYISEHYRIDAICASDLQRAVNTVRPLADALGLEVETYRGLRELDVGLWAGRSHKELAILFPENYQSFQADMAHGRCDGGESYAELYARATRTIREIAAKYEGKTIAVASHGGAIRCILAEWDGDGLEDVNKYSFMPNTAISELIFENEKIYFEKIGISDHLNATEEPLNIV